MKKIKKIIVIVGPTATGKTDLAVRLAEKLNTYIISGDSMQIYRYFKIGTAQPDLSAIDVPYYLVNQIEPTERFSVYDFKQAANEIIDHNSTIPIIAGGTGLYINSFLRNYSLGELEEKQYQDFLMSNENLNLTDLINWLQEIDPTATPYVDLANKRRVLRAIAIKKLTGRSIVDQKESEVEFDPYIIGLNTARNVLYERIEKRVDQMMEQGIVYEAEDVYIHQEDYPLLTKAIAYKEFFPYFAKNCELSASVALLKQKSRNYAKRQLTWFRNKMQVNWYDLSEPDFITQIEHDVMQWLAFLD
ncbi:tRNA (adenosine(37)-N6)-dimethylallyltransferase MiaA [Xylocopilactobacillus apicola]|uniref:tRNA dimethylallyltransferase n=1 Tax=Xylocopilactobacillus apicola TaxID=2932184 RepID=A0AAU9DN05_9LACO|nr:tRNA (adenosine(37)-N6)-dimethylallyltransferase MiaA [Xylocopilactobacillus apicola]BDR58407.1 tRNA dimethylallyltransferase [Xylocopilactobacillus apicola]